MTMLEKIKEHTRKAESLIPYADIELKKELKEIIEKLKDYEADIELNVYKRLDNAIKKIINKKNNKILSNELPEVLKIAQGHPTNAMKGMFPNMEKNRLIKDENYKCKNVNQTYLVEYGTPAGKIKNYETKIAITDLPSTRFPIKDVVFSKFFTFLHYQFDRQGSCYKFTFTSREFLKFLGKEPTPNIIKKTNMKIRTYCEEVFPNIRLKWSEGKTNFATIVPFAGVGIKRGVVVFEFAPSYADSISNNKKNRFYNLPKEVGTLSEHAFLMADFIYSHARQSRKNEFKLTIKTLYKKTGLPSYEEIQKGTHVRNTSKKIKEPFYKALQEIKDTVGIESKDILSIHKEKNKMEYKLEIQEDEIKSDKWEDFLNSKINFKIISKKAYSKIVKKKK